MYLGSQIHCKERKRSR